MSVTAISNQSQSLVVEGQHPTALEPLQTHTSWAPPLRMMDPLDAAFGYTLSSSSLTHESRHDERRAGFTEEEILPSYAEESRIPLPEYTPNAPEPVTLAMFLFKFGFLFPPFWIFGMFIFFSPLREPGSIGPSDESSSTPAWMPEKTESERQQIIETIRAVELKWAKRCLVAFFIFAALAIGGGLSAWALLHRS